VRVTRVHAAAPLDEGATLALPERAAVHLVRVLRMRTGDGLVVFDGAGAEHEAAIVAVRGERVDVRIGAPRTPAPESPLAITLVQGVSRGERMDYTIQKATELGVNRIVPVLAERSVVRLDAAQAAKKREHWLGVASSACEQSGRATHPAPA
jgi:16S rRNA (uracil1498-N3)-methyltransferase